MIFRSLLTIPVFSDQSSIPRSCSVFSVTLFSSDFRRRLFYEDFNAYYTMKSSSGHSTDRKRKREVCTICCSKGKNGNGHIADYCAYEGGPYFNNLRGSLAQRRLDEQQRKQSRTTSPATGGASAEDLQTKIDTKIDTKIAQYLTKFEDREIINDERCSSNDDRFNNLGRTITKQAARINEQDATIKEMKAYLTDLRWEVDELKKEVWR
jgi:hypothetical protein